MTDTTPAVDGTTALHRTTQRFVGIAQALTFMMGVLGVVAGIGLAAMKREADGLIASEERPYIWAGIVVVVGAVWLTVLVLAALSYLEWRLGERTYTSNQIPPTFTK